jgi:PmbA protein
MREDLVSLASRAVEIAKSAGASDVFATASRNRSVEFQVRDGKLEKVQEATSRALSARLYVDGRYSTHATTDLRPDRLDSFLREAVALTRALQPDPHRRITDPALYQGRSSADLDLVDPSVRDLRPEDRVHLCEVQNQLLVGQDKVISATSGASDSHGVSASVSSNGFSGHHESTSLWIGSEVTLQDEGDKRPEAWMWGGARHRSDVPPAEHVAKTALTRARQRLGAKKGPTKRTVMVVDPSVASSIVARFIGPAYASRIQQGRSCFEGKIGEKVASSRLTLIDEPLIRRGLSSRTYDGEGIAAKKLAIIEGGVLRNVYVDTYYGKKLGMAPTTGGSSNLTLALGSRDLAAIVASVSDGIYVEGWLGGNADTTTGDFSLGARGRLIQKGKLADPVAEMNVTGNLLTLFSNLSEVGSDPWPYSSLLAPTLVFEDVQFGGT